MDNTIFNPMEIDAIGEIMNISLGSSATAVSNLLDHRVDITTPRVSVVAPEQLYLGDMEPAVGVEIHYVSGLEGSNIMLLKRNDVKAIVDILMGSETADEEFELNDLTISAVCEVMNQMMGGAATALSDFLGRMVNISTPQSFELDTVEQFKTERFPDGSGPFVVVRFMLSIEGILKSEFVNVISVNLAQDLIAGFGLGEMSSEAIAPLAEEAGGALSNEAAAAMAAPGPSSSGGSLSQEEIERLLGGGSDAGELAMPDIPNKKLSQDDVERLMASALDAPPQPAASSGGSLSQAEIEALMQSSAAAPPPAPPDPGMYPPGAYPPYPPPWLLPTSWLLSTAPTGS